MSEHSHRAVPLPGELVLLLHKPNGSHYAATNPNIATAAAEIGELALRHRVTAERGKWKRVKLHVLDPSSSGTPWADSLLERLVTKSGPQGKPIELSSWLSRQTSAFNEHRRRLTRHGLLTRRKHKFLGVIAHDRHFVDELVRDSLISEIRQVIRVERPIDNRLALLTALVHASNLARPLGFGRDERRMVKSIAKGEHLGGAVEAAIAETGAAIATGAAAAGAGGGGDGGGGDGGGGA
ncbi:Golgi phosphoprotein 3 GPP34 [Halopolyspora algeriensis]|uniref:Golgi phosphoprotein 3 GPP34 n=1 Tax=Halopolyspora algeriensis TaxID=1500506 RepID=A0A368VY49_9ACTN|nr:GPP34 family phosphoprotein [Halopolyspora algeriensis]RCW47116.1 Golgi phosphoprotein 3 GPP34 [Halopolyspora algeriensis]TQM48203.1 Golgi phosphoprotein 3 GPP34 [Halopolyspora algeriensis]